jgi:segregation and condensation protein B
MERPEMKAVVEAILFTAGDAIGVEELAAALDATPLEMRSLVDELAAEYNRDGRGIRLIRLEDSVQLCTNAQYAPYIRAILAPQQSKPLTQAAMETLSIIAYKQPVTRREIEALRGVQCDYAVAALMDKNLIKVVGHGEGLGRPALLGTTDEFLRCFGLASLADLPALQNFDISGIAPAREEMASGE